MAAESMKNKRDRASKIHQYLAGAYPDATVPLSFSNAYELLVATILAAQCTDAKVNEVTPALFGRFPTAEKLAKARTSTLERMIRPTGFFRSKSKSIRCAARAIVERHAGEVPRTMEEMLALPGVARKTANVVLQSHGVTSGVVVDTHNVRLTNRLGFVETKDPVEIERFWLAAADRRDWSRVGHLLYSHGQAVCRARKPRHSECVVEDICPSRGI
jgi:endonuclease-3